MNQTTSFKDLNITAPAPKSFIGEKIAMKKVLNKEIIIHDYKTSPSNFEGTRLDMQITYDKELRMLWTSSFYLSETIKQIPKSAFPITTTIVEIQDRFQFT